jgi:RNA polymerase sigma-70 factor (TIGR02957 family)
MREPDQDDLVAGFEAHRRPLFGIAYRMLGSASEAEDVVQDAFLRWSRADRAALRDPGAWLRAVTVNLCLDQLGSARAQREHYVGLWLPEPVLTGSGALGPLETVEQRESVSLALLLLLERLTPRERAVFVLREAFCYGYEEIASVLGLSEAACRQLLHRARQRIGEDRSRFQPSPEETERLLGAFLRAAEEGDVAAVERLMVDEVVSLSDGGERMPVARRPVLGPDRVARLLVGQGSTYLKKRAAVLVPAEVNGAPGVLIWSGEALLAVVTFEIRPGGFSGIHVAANPDKLAFAARQAVPGQGAPARS